MHSDVAPEKRIRLGISSCLLGEKVRYDGGHKRDRFLTDTFGRYVDWVPVCPEVECGLPVPRPSMRLVGDCSDPHLVVTRSGEDLTAKMKRFAKNRVQALANENLDGFIFKSGSPSSGMERVAVYNQQGMPVRNGVGMFAREFINRFPLLPVEDEGRLHDPQIRENFIDRVFCLHRYRSQLQSPGDMRQLIAFHSVHKYQLMAHSPSKLKEMGQFVAHGKKMTPKKRVEGYESLLLMALKHKTSLAKHQNVMQHMMGYLKNQLSNDEKREIEDIIGQYRAGHIPLIVPVTLIQHFVRKYNIEYLKQQSYLNPHPLELKLRNHV